MTYHLRATCHFVGQAYCHCGEFTVVMPEPHATLQGAVTWRNQCHDRATLQGVRIPSAILKIVFAILFCFLNTVWALTSGGFRIVSDTLVISYMYCGIRYMLPMCTIKQAYCSVVVGVTFGVLVINTSSTVSHEQQTTPLISDESHQLATVRHSCVYNTGSRTVDNMR